MLIERQSKVMIVLNIHHKTDEAVNCQLDQWLAKLPRHFVKSITFETESNYGREIANKYDLHTYFAQSRCSQSTRVKRRNASCAR